MRPRNNPLASLMQRTAATRTMSEGRFPDLHADLLGARTLVPYGAMTTMAVDGLERNSSYAATFAASPEIELRSGPLRSHLLAVTHSKQSPLEYHPLVCTSWLTRPRATSASTTVIPAVLAEPGPTDPPRPDPPKRGIRELRIGVLDELPKPATPSRRPSFVTETTSVSAWSSTGCCRGLASNTRVGTPPGRGAGWPAMSNPPPHSQPVPITSSLGAAHD